MADAAPPPLNTTLRDIDGNFSSKRIAAFIALGGVLVLAGADLFGHHPSEYIVNALTFIACTGLGMACAERFAPHRDP